MSLENDKVRDALAVLEKAADGPTKVIDRLKEVVRTRSSELSAAQRRQEELQKQLDAVEKVLLEFGLPGTRWTSTAGRVRTGITRDSEKTKQELVQAQRLRIRAETAERQLTMELANLTQLYNKSAGPILFQQGECDYMSLKSDIEQAIEREVERRVAEQIEVTRAQP